MTQKALDKHWLIVSDLDGTLLDHFTYSHAPVDALLRQLEASSVPVILNSSKTRDEMLEIRRELDNRHPFIVENGSAIFIPSGYFPDMPAGAREQDDFWVLEPGLPRERLLDHLQSDAEAHGAPYLGFSAAPVEEIVSATGLSPEQARAAKARSYSEPLLWRGSEEEKRDFRARASDAGLATLEGGRFLHLLGDTDKGRATRQLLGCYRRAAPASYTLVAAGDSPNDLDMLEVADIALIIRGPHREPPQLEETDSRRVLTSRLEGPEGWRECIEQLIQPHSGNGDNNEATATQRENTRTPRPHRRQQ
ncbi:HAD-IIB family hydrolase [Microbulbifer yueqingensis]|uniref:Mannosyl-3-phosphoglycerate phosphatase n=1 Tax=Microbulbifer yueqingensis TaxID=658219 RepID=A0A1G8V3A8_9GAMM|nr:HAD-IIB family hydrolase [Microbulbifer yueqingensis]SDJ60479.1 mannosyl-3-phosphoglycerate phosphatase [Microbulbifer yueqingensis]